jgi:hypothetical protein
MKYETELNAKTSNKAAMENHNKLNGMSCLFVRAISNGLAKQRPKYNEKNDKNRLAISNKSNMLLLGWESAELQRLTQGLKTTTNFRLNLLIIEGIRVR